MPSCLLTTHCLSMLLQGGSSKLQLTDSRAPAPTHDDGDEDDEGGMIAPAPIMRSGAVTTAGSNGRAPPTKPVLPPISPTRTPPPETVEVTNPLQQAEGGGVVARAEGGKQQAEGGGVGARAEGGKSPSPPEAGD